MEEPFRPAAGVVLLRSEAAEVEAQLRIREAAVEAHLGLLVAAYQESLHKVRVLRLCFCVEMRVREVPAALPVGAVPPLRSVSPERAHWLKRFDRLAGRLPPRLKTVHRSLISYRSPLSLRPFGRRG